MARSITSTIITAEAREMKLDGPKVHLLDLVQSESSDKPYHVQRCIRPNATTFVFGIIEIQRTAAKMSQEKLKIKKA
jgi:hypothetical protein